MKNITVRLSALLTGLINALLGAGGGLIAVPLFKKEGLSQKQAQASAISVILPLCLLSTGVYYYMGYFSFRDAVGYIPFGLVGSFVGSFLMKKMPDKLLRKLFSLFMIYSGIRMLMR